MSAYSIFALGTFETSENDKNIITEFYKECVGNKLLLNGPQRLIHPEAVERNVETAIKKIVEWLGSQATRASNEKFHINLAGFSRGAVTCIRIANSLHNYLMTHKVYNNQGQLITVDDLELNIFAIDPVAGLFEKYKRRSQVLPTIVRNYTAILQMHENRNDIKPQDLKRIHIVDSRKTNVVMLPMYGHHRSIKKIVSPDLAHCTRILWQQFYRYMRQHGTQFTKIPAIPNAKNKLIPISEVDDFHVLDYFAIAKRNKESYEAANEWGASLSGNAERSFVKYISEYVSNPEFFMNEYEKHIFKKHYPVITSYLFEGGAGSNYNKLVDFQTAVHAELRILQTKTPRVYESLSIMGLAIDRKGLIQIPPTPLGMQPLALADEVMRKLHRYRHIKPEWKVFSKPDEYARSIAIEYEVKRIKKLNVDEATKINMVLNEIEKHYLILFRNGSSSKLLVFLHKVLSHHHRTYKDSTDLGITVIFGKGIEVIGSTLKKAGQLAALFVGLTGVVTEFVGNLTRALGNLIASALYWTRIFYPLGLLVEGVTFGSGALVSVVGWGIKQFTKKYLSPALELLGQGVRYIAQGIVVLSNAFQITRDPIKPVSTQAAALMNPALRQLISKPASTTGLSPEADLVHKPIDEKQVIPPIPPMTYSSPESLSSVHRLKR